MHILKHVPLTFILLSTFSLSAIANNKANNINNSIFKNQKIFFKNNNKILFSIKNVSFNNSKKDVDLIVNILNIGSKPFPLSKIFSNNKKLITTSHNINIPILGNEFKKLLNKENISIYNNIINKYNKKIILLKNNNVNRNKLTVDYLKKYGSSMNTPLYFTNLPFLKITIIKGLYDKQKKKTKMLIKIKNTSFSTLNLKNLLPIGNYTNKILKGYDSTNVVITDSTFLNYLTEESKKIFLKEQQAHNKLVSTLSLSLNRIVILKQEIINFGNKLNNSKISNDVLNKNIKHFNKMLLDYILIFPEHSIHLASEIITGNSFISLDTLPFEQKFSILKVLISDYSSKLSKYQYEKVSEILNKNIIFEHQYNLLLKETQSYQPFFESLNKLTLKTNKNSNISILSATINKIRLQNNTIIHNNHDILGFFKKVENLKLINSKLKIENKNLYTFINNNVNNNKKTTLLENNNRILKDKNKQLQNEKLNLSEKNSIIMKENAEVFDKYNLSQNIIIKLQKENLELKEKIKYLRKIL